MPRLPRFLLLRVAPALAAWAPLTRDEGCGTGVGGVAHGLYAVRHDRSESRVDVGVSMLAIVLFNITVLVIEGLSETRDRLVQHIQRLVPAISITERCVF